MYKKSIFLLLISFFMFLFTVNTALAESIDPNVPLDTNDFANDAILYDFETIPEIDGSPGMTSEDLSVVGSPVGSITLSTDSVYGTYSWQKTGAKLGYSPIVTVLTTVMGASDQEFAVGYWFKTDDHTVTQPVDIFNLDDGSSGTGDFDLEYDQGALNGWELQFSNNNLGGNMRCLFRDVVTDNDWHHYAFYVEKVSTSRNTVHMYIDGVVVASYNDDDGITSGNGCSNTLGNGYNMFESSPPSFDELYVLPGSISGNVFIDDMVILNWFTDGFSMTPLVSNSAPVVSTLNFNSVDDVYADQNTLASVSVADDDADSITAYFDVYVNDIYQTQLTFSDTAPVSAFVNISETYYTAGDNLTVYAWANDGTDNSNNISLTETVLPVPECRDGLDNDGDGATDFPDDFSCLSLGDTDETIAVSLCQDGLDNDGDGAIDYPNDVGCLSAQDNDETPNTQCQDGVDNDGDGATDFPDDVFCNSASQNDEGDGTYNYAYTVNDIPDALGDVTGKMLVDSKDFVSAVVVIGAMLSLFYLGKTFIWGKL